MIPDGVQTVRLGDVVSPHFCVFVARVVHVVASLNRPGPIFIENDDRPSPVYLCSLNGDTAHSHTLHHRSGFIAPRSTFLAQRSADPGLSISISPQENKQSTDCQASTFLFESDLHHSAITFGGPILLSVICSGYCHLRLNWAQQRRSTTTTRT
jgi:hypothetical protein